MPKTKLVMDFVDFRKLPFAARLSNIQTGDALKTGNEIHVEISFKEPGQLVKLGKYLHTVTEDEVKAYEAKAKQAAKK